MEENQSQQAQPPPQESAVKKAIAGGLKTNLGAKVLAAQNIEDVEDIVEDVEDVEDELPQGLPEAARPTLPSNLP